MEHAPPAFIKYKVLEFGKPETSASLTDLHIPNSHPKNHFNMPRQMSSQSLAKDITTEPKIMKPISRDQVPRESQRVIRVATAIRPFTSQAL